MINYIALAVAVLCFVAILNKHIPTGVLGSAALAVIGMAALVAIDDSSFSNIVRLEAIVTALLLGFLGVAAHILLMVWRGSTGRATRRRRTTDWQSFDAEDTRPMGRA